MSRTSGPWRPDDAGRGSAGGEGGGWRRRLGFAGGPLALENPAVRELLDRRLRVLEIGVVALACLLLLGFWHLQVVHGSHYAAQAEDNRLREPRLRPARGLILDRQGRVLANSRAAYQVAVVREDIDDLDATLAWLADVLRTTPDELRTRLDRYAAEVPAFRPVVVADDVPLETVATVEARRRDRPGVQVLVEAKRHYPNGTLGAHFLGHVGEIGARQLERRGAPYRMGDIVGQGGLERVYEGHLFGEPGLRQIVVDSSGRTVRVLQERPARPGSTLVLAIDLELQRVAEEQLRDRRGAVVVLDVSTGGVLAMASTPTFDPNDFASRFSLEDWRRLANDPRKPLQNRAILSTYPPGSVFKLVMAAGGLDHSVIDPSTTVFCAGGGNFYGRFFRCLAQHGTVDLRAAIARSCNTYFYEVGRRLGRERIVATAEALGFGRPTGIDLPDEGPGILPSDRWLAAQGRRWMPGETISVSIGQGVLGVSALQLAHMAASLASGKLRRPRLLGHVEDPTTGRSVLEPGSTPTDLPVEPAARQAILDGMRRSVLSGTSGRARLPGLEVGGKTGTAQVASLDRVGPNDSRPEELRDHAWFVGLAPIDDPDVVVAVFVQHGGSGSVTAAPIARAVLDAYFNAGPGRAVADRGGAGGHD